MWKPTNPPATNVAKPTNTESEKSAMTTSSGTSFEPTPASAPRNANMNTAEQATIPDHQGRGDGLGVALH
jgi:hypothetical protein